VANTTQNTPKHTLLKGKFIFPISSPSPMARTIPHPSPLWPLHGSQTSIPVTLRIPSLLLIQERTTYYITQWLLEGSMSRASDRRGRTYVAFKAFSAMISKLPLRHWIYGGAFNSEPYTTCGGRRCIYGPYIIAKPDPLNKQMLYNTIYLRALKS